MKPPAHGQNELKDVGSNRPDDLLRLLNSAVIQAREAILITDSQIDPPGPHIVYANPAFTAMTGYDNDFVIGKTPRILQGPKTDRSVLDRLRRSLKAGELFEGEAINYKKDGTEFVMEWQVAPIRESTGAITHFVAIQRDVTGRKKAEIAANRLAAIVESSDDAIIGKDLNGIVNSWNNGAAKLFGYTENEMIGTSITRLIPDDRLYEEETILSRIRSGQSVEQFETVRKTKSGSLIDVAVTASPIKDAHGRVVGVSKSARDIGWRKNAEAIKVALEGRYRALFEHAPDGILIADSEGRYVDANASICRMLGYTPEELFGLSFSTIVAQDELPQVLPTLQAIKAGSDEFREWQFRRKDGSLFSAELMATMMPDGKLMGIVRDVTERKHSEERIAEQAAFMDKARDAIIVRDLKGNILYWNKGAERIYGWERREVLGRNIGDVIYKEPEIFQELNAKTIEKGDWNGEIQHICKDRKEITVEIRWTLIRDGKGNPKSVLAINTDITEKKKIEAQFMRAQRLESIGTLAGGIAHDLNNILTPIMMSIEVLKQHYQDDESLQTLESIELSAKRGADIVRQVLSFARGLEGERVEVQPKHLLNDLQSIIRDTFPKDIRLRFLLPSDIWPIFGDPTQVHQILLNLCVNARDAMPNGGVLTVSARNQLVDAQYTASNPQVKAGRYVVIEVIDTGTGIPTDIIDKIFEPFFTTKDVNKGTGLGLSTVLAIVKSHEGIINVYSEPNKGTTFRIYLPAMEAFSEKRRDLDERGSLPRGHGELILIVDDEASVRTITSQTLQAFGYRVLTATDGADAVAVYLQNKDAIAVVLTDIMMPIMDGPAMIHAITRINQKVKIVATSGLGANSEDYRLLASGVKHFLTKPYTARALLKSMRDVLYPN